MDPIGNSAFSCKCAKLNFLKFGSSQKASTESEVFKFKFKLKFGQSKKLWGKAKFSNHPSKGVKRGQKCIDICQFILSGEFLPDYIARASFASLYYQANFGLVAKPLWFLLQCLIAVRLWDLVLTLSDYWCTRSTLGVPTWDLTNICKNIVKKNTFYQIDFESDFGVHSQIYFWPLFCKLFLAEQFFRIFGTRFLNACHIS